MKYLLMYFVLCLIAFVFYCVVHKALVRHVNHMDIFTHKPKTIPSVLYYGGKFLSGAFIFAFYLLFFPVFLFSVYIKNRERKSAADCFSAHSPFKSDIFNLDSLQQSIKLASDPNSLKKRPLHCPFWDAYSERKHFHHQYLCTRHCPCFTCTSNFLLLGKEQETAYARSAASRDSLINIDDYSL